MAGRFLEDQLGPHTFVEEYFFYDVLRWFSIIDSSGQLYLVIWNGVELHDNEWAILPLSRERLDAVIAGDLDLGKAFLQSETETRYFYRPESTAEVFGELPEDELNEFGSLYRGQKLCE